MEQFYLCKVKKYHLYIAALAFLMCIISAYFGIRVYDANQNHLITHLNEFDKIYHDDVKNVPAISRMAAMFTFVFLLAILIFQFLAFRKSTIKQVRNLCIGMLTGGLLLLIIDIMVFADPVAFDFSKWGYAWVFMGLVFIAGNILSYAIYRFKK